MTAMHPKRRPSEVHSSEYVRRILEVAADKDPSQYRRAAERLRSKTVQVTIEAARDERFYLIGGQDSSLDIKGRNRNDKTDIVLRTSPGSLRKILEGVETPVEAFFFGHLRAKGNTRDLYSLHAFFVALAEIAVASPDIQSIIESFQRAKEN
jgi:putative sterol carrier protein